MLSYNDIPKKERINTPDFAECEILKRNQLKPSKALQCWCVKMWYELVQYLLWTFHSHFFALLGERARKRSWWSWPVTKVIESGAYIASIQYNTCSVYEVVITLLHAGHIMRVCKDGFKFCNTIVKGLTTICIFTLVFVPWVVTNCEPSGYFCFSVHIFSTLVAQSGTI